MSASPEELLAHASSKVRERALLLQGSVQARTRDGNVVRARVQGSRRAPYRVMVDLGRSTRSCSCPDDYNAICKHVCATLLMSQASPETFDPAPAPRRLPNVQGWADADVEHLLERVLQNHPAVVRDWARVVAEDEGFDEDEW
ncbi:SWIM zinc finger family protein [Deinococcus arenicola]|uniref:SWIM zinc finger family protein n=1 Tax=Deinococcus arenicola TaxID=2994950 RepID=A0ABU4DLF4_9DEIO|nr:SWIM zinc finger family protein [Deinococcus sp. ZS9-10]MDV6373260.1 SWIM zinc finger family protein [Deinococcus sp. ZS9-10]